ncbi:MAG: DUF1036 domain-containing protein [Proteobacteria bacterium]|nr:DUF1036 domain-containing protein [Pseudomonadota bacterium]
MTKEFLFRVVLGMGALVLAAAPQSASAAFKLCNQTSYVLYSAIGFPAGSDMLTQGWTRVVPGYCATLVPGALNASSYFLFAHSSQAHAGQTRNWGGQTGLCAKETNFSLRDALGSMSCKAEDAFMMSFAQVDTKGMKSWTTTLTESPQIKDMNAAQVAGLTRLLNDAGYRFGGPQASKARDEALRSFRMKMKLPGNATDKDLFDALETEALKATAPAGYSICNDTQQAVWAALGLHNGNQWVSRGWWNIAAGSCARAMTTPLAMEKVYLLVERHKQKPLVTGKSDFCVTDIEFDITGRERCKDRGLREAGFAETNTKGIAGYAAHVSEAGLLPNAPVLR